MKIALVSLGCPKNQADADVFCRNLIEDGYETVADIEQADIIIINTCGFIQSAAEEAISHILEACEIKSHNPDVKVVVTGCLAERYKGDIAKEIPEVDAVVGIGSNGKLSEILAGLTDEEHTAAVESYGAKTDLKIGGARVISTPEHYAWLKIAEGCSNACSYCAIPSIRGPLRSRPVQDCVAEARWLAEQGVKEIVLVAQDVTAYGNDIGGDLLVPLLEQLDEIEGISWIRLLYAYPERITGELLDYMRTSSKVLPYLDLPLQHCNEEILRSMRRKGGAAAVRNAVEMIREKLPNAVLRTTLITGYPGETQQQFEELLEFVKEVEFDRLGCFAYSEEEGTAAAGFSNQIPQQLRADRADEVMKLQSNIMAKKQQAMVGKEIVVMCDGYDEEQALWMCRSAADAPEIDANVLVDSKQDLQQGGLYKVLVTGADTYDLYAETV